MEYRCKACNDTGYVVYHKIINGYDYEFGSQCNCESASGLDYDGTMCREEKNRSNFYLEKAFNVFCGKDLKVE